MGKFKREGSKCHGQRRSPTNRATTDAIDRSGNGFTALFSLARRFDQAAFPLDFQREFFFTGQELLKGAEKTLATIRHPPGDE